MKSNVSAYWTFELEVTCPKCESLFDLTDNADFWKNGKYEAGEHGTPLTRDVSVACPECAYEFLVDFKY